jgi:YVTN family beta-propeller protein
VTATANNASIVRASNVAPVTVLAPTPTRTATPTATSTPGCTDLIRNGGFETDEAWTIPQTAGTAGYSTDQHHTGQRSMRLGGTDRSFSTAYQIFDVPGDAHDVTLSFWYYPLCADTAHDYQYVLVLDDATGGILEWLRKEALDARQWTLRQHPLDAYKGRRIRIHFSVYNDGTAGATSMYVDDVSVPICAATPTPTLPPFTSSAWLYLPVILRPSGGQEARPQPALTQQGEALGLPSVVRTLWQSQEGDARPDFIQGVALNPANDVLYLAAGQALWALDANTGRILAQIALNATPRGLAVDVARNRVYAALWDANALAVIDGAKNTLLRSVPDIPGASGVAVAQGRVYVTATRSDELIVVDAQNDAIMQRIPVGQAPYGVACDYDEPRRVFVTNAGEDSVSILDGRSGATLHTVHLGGLGHPQGLAFDAVRDRLYVTYTLAPRYGAIAVLDASTGQILSRLTGNFTRPLFGAYGVAVDPLRGWVYLSTVEGAYVLAGETLDVMHEVPGVGPAYAFGMALDAAGGRLFLVDGRQQRLAICSP